MADPELPWRSRSSSWRLRELLLAAEEFPLAGEELPALLHQPLGGALGPQARRVQGLSRGAAVIDGVAPIALSCGDRHSPTQQRKLASHPQYT